MAGILEGLRIVESAAFIAAPLGGMTLAQLGAEVIRCDPIGGGLDYKRWPVTKDGKSLYWVGLNKGKRSIAVDTASPRGREIVSALATAPGPGNGVFVTNFPARGWLAYDTLRQRRSDLIMVNIIGNPDGSSALDYTVNCAVGYPLATGPADHQGAINHLLPAWDAICGVTAAVGMLAAERHRNRTGEGQFIKLPLADIAFAMTANLGHVAEYQINGEARPRYGNALYGAFGRDFVTRDGKRLMVVAITLKQWQSLLEASGLAAEVAAIEKQQKVDFAREGDRFIAREALFPLFERWIAARDLAEIATGFDRLGVCWGLYRDFGDMVANDPRCSPTNPMFDLIDQPGIGQFLAAGSPLDFSAVARLSPAPAPLLGQHNAEVYGQVLDYSASDLVFLRKAGVI